MKRAIAAAALVIAALSSPAQAGLVTNGGFETGDLSSWTLSGNPTFDFASGGFFHTGNFSLWMGEVGGLATLSQTLSTAVGGKYNLTFWFAGDGDNPSEFQALIGSTVLMDVVNPAFDLDFLPYTFSFTATSTSTVLAFKFRDDAFFMNLDDVDVVQVAAVPEPESLVLVLAGLLGLTASRAAKRKARRSA